MTDSGERSLKRYDLLVKNGCSMLNVDWLHRAVDFGDMYDKVTDFTTDFRKSQKSNMLFPEIIARIVCNKSNFASVKDIMKEFNLNLRTAQRYVNRLSKLRWLALHTGYSARRLNPFLELMLYLNFEATLDVIKTFSPHHIDVFDVYSYPLLLALKDDIKEVDFIWAHYDGRRYDYLPNTKIFMDTDMWMLYWNGLCQIRAQGKNTHYAILPYNIHWTGRNCHITLPIPWKFYGVESACRSKGELKIQFDNSINISLLLGSAYYNNRKKARKTGKRYIASIHDKFMKEYWENEYVECFDFESHEKAIRERLIDKTIPVDKFQEKELLMKDILRLSKYR